MNVLENAGYGASFFCYRDNLINLDINSHLHSPARIELDVLIKNNWFLVPGTAKGNVATYDFCDSLLVNITSHSNNQTVTTGSVTVSGTFKNPQQESDPLTKLLISCSKGTGSRQVEASVNDSTFSADIDLEPGKNTLTLLPTHRNSDGRDVLFPKYIIKAKDTKIDGLVLNYEQALIGKLDFERITTSITTSPDTSVRVSTVQITADLILNFKASKLSYILQSHANAVSCAESDNCYLFSGKNSGQVTITVAEELKSRDCNGNVPLIVTESLNGKTALSDYSLTIEVSLSPWTVDDTSTRRNYHLRVYGAPSYKINTSSDWPVADGKLYDCNDKAWKTYFRKIGPGITVEDDDSLKFIDSDDLEQFAAAPEAGKAWGGMSSITVSEDYSTTTVYKATLSIFQP